MIKKVAGGYKVVSESGKKNLGGPYKTKKEAEKRPRQVEFFKHRKRLNHFTRRSPSDRLA